MESLTIPVSVFGAAEASADLFFSGVLAGICIWAAMSGEENVRNAMVFTTARLVFILVFPFLGLVEVVLLWSQSFDLHYSAGSGRNVPFRKARSFINTKNTGTRIRT
jgi:hypothetical protein